MAKKQKNTENQPDWKPESPYNELPELPPSHELETPKVLKRLVEARAAVASLQQACQRIPNAAILINTLPLLESQASSEIENIVTTNDRLFRYRSQSDEADPATKEALRYSYALLEGFQSLEHRPLMTSTTEAICSVIKDQEMRVRTVGGIALAKGSGKVVYTPPEGERRLRDLLANWERFMHLPSTLDPLVRMSVGHYQFEAIHPFTDGNGRTGRIINSLYLISAGLLDLPVLYLSRYLIENRKQYYRLLLGVTRDEAWEAWLLFMLSGVEQTANWTREKIEAICRLFEITCETAKLKLGGTYRHELIALLFELPYCRIQDVLDRELCSRPTASNALKRLAKIDILEEERVGREKLFVHRRLLKLLTEPENEFAPYN